MMHRILLPVSMTSHKSVVIRHMPVPVVGFLSFWHALLVSWFNQIGVSTV